MSEERGSCRDRDDARRQHLAGTPLTERRLELAGIQSAALEGEGPPVVLRHGRGESAVNWRWVIPAPARHALGGAIGARFAVDTGNLRGRLVLVDALGLARFRHSPRFVFGLAGFAARPSDRGCERFMRQCAFDLDSPQSRMGKAWAPLAAYNLELAHAARHCSFHGGRDA